MNNRIIIKIRNKRSKTSFTRRFDSKEIFEDEMFVGMVFKKHTYEYYDYGKFLGQIHNIENPMPEICIHNEHNSKVLRETFTINLEGVMLTVKNNSMFKIIYSKEMTITLQHKTMETFPWTKKQQK